MQPMENYNTAGTCSADSKYTGKTLLSLCFHTDIGNYVGCPAREIQCKHCMKLDILCEYVLVLQISNRYAKLLVPEVPVMSADRNSPRLTAHIATCTVNVAAVNRRATSH